nr:MAG TPA: minor capsid protein [Caudoviricetes sp.]
MQSTEKDIESVPQPIVSLFNDLEQTIMLDIIRRLQANNKEITRSADWQINRLYELGKSKEEIKNYIKNTLNLSDEQIDKVFSNAISSGYARDKSLYDTVGKSFIPYEDNLQLQQLVNSMITQTKGELKNITGSLGFALREPNSTKLTYTPLTDYYQSTLDKAITQIATGAFDYNTVLRNTVKEMTNSGLRYIDYDSGYSSRVSVAVRRAVLTGYNQVVANINESNAEKLETNYFETTYHSGARPTHQPWQGRVYSKEELVSVCGLGTVTGLCGANCYHNYYPFIKGVSERTYTDEELDRMNQEDNEKREFRGKSYTKYEALQRQRKLETIMRAERQEIKLLTEGGADENDIMSANARYNKTSDEYARLSKAMNLPQQRQRVNIDGLGNIGAKLDKSSKVAKSNSTKITENGVHRLSDSGDNTNFEKTIQNSKSNIEKSNDSGMIKAKDSNNNETVVDDVHKIGKINIDIYKCVTEDITTDEVIITEKQIQHIKERHPNDYEMYFNYAKEIVENPDYVLQANKPYTAFILKHIVENGKNYQIILRLKTSDDPNEYKNSIITFLKVSDKRYNRYLRTKKILYKAE